MEYEHITTDEQLKAYCRKLEDSAYIGFDTEFVSEDSYRPDLCLIQVACEHGLAVIDTIEMPDVGLFWEVLTTPGHRTIAHAAREELRFCLKATGKRPNNLFDTQLAAGMIGLEYPAAYSTLLSRLLSKSIPKGETRTNWRQRPLSDRQIDYALQDVVHLNDLHTKLHNRLEEMGRVEWLADEIETWQQKIEDFEGSSRWQRLGGLNNMSRRSLAIAREVWTWRERIAEGRNSPPKRILRDDLLVELAKRKTADVKRIRSLRGMDHRGVQRYLPEISECIATALALPEDDCPQPMRARKSGNQMNLLSQFLTVSLSAVCRDSNVAASLVGTTQDMRDLAFFHMGKHKGNDPPKLNQGWRREIVGSVIEQLLRGELSVYIASQDEDQPLGFEKR